MPILLGDPLFGGVVPDVAEAPVAPRCGFLRRWWHGRLRSADVLMMLPSIRTAAHRHRADESWQELCWHVWVCFTYDRGHEHWRCACGATKRLDRTEVCVESIPALAKRVA